MNLRLIDEVDDETFAAKNTELRDRIAAFDLKIKECSDGNQTDTALKLFELSQTLKDKWLTSDCRQKRRILNTVCLNFKLNDANLEYTIRKPFDVLAEGLDSAENRGDRI